VPMEERGSRELALECKLLHRWARPGACQMGLGRAVAALAAGAAPASLCTLAPAADRPRSPEFRLPPSATAPSRPATPRFLPPVDCRVSVDFGGTASETILVMKIQVGAGWVQGMGLGPGVGVEWVKV
jgi:hypothetical protein